MTPSSRKQAAFIALAIGDALGAPVEFKSQHTFKPISDYRAGGPWNLPAGYWTDDTSLAICLAEHILDNRCIDPEDLMHRFLRWYELGENSSMGTCFDVGMTTVQAFHNYLRTRTYVKATNIPELNGNGALMRLAPVVCAWAHDHVVMQSHVITQCEVTHGATECVDTCVELANLMQQAILGRSVHEQLCVWAQSEPSTLKNIPGTAGATLHAAKWAVGTSHSLSDAILKAVNLGGDTDTVGAVTGQLAGAIWGLEHVPDAWINGLHDADRLQHLALELSLMHEIKV